MALADDIRAVKAALAVNAANGGIGVFHVPTEQIVMRPFDESGGGGHAGVAAVAGGRSPSAAGLESTCLSSATDRSS